MSEKREKKELLKELDLMEKFEKRYPTLKNNKGAYEIFKTQQRANEGGMK